MEFNQHTVELMFAALWAVSEFLGENKAIAANSVYGLVKAVLKSIVGK